MYGVKIFCGSNYTNYTLTGTNYFFEKNYRNSFRRSDFVATDTNYTNYSNLHELFF